MPKLLFVVTEDWFFVSHFLPMAGAAKAAGFAVAVATRIRRHGDAIAREGTNWLNILKTLVGSPRAKRLF